ncbi:biotin/lipoate--protein ligase family protein [Jannaschia sp. S6380]|uniref:biotin/lipoate--protein ligase family protein n=1 Tax=Jannaschia sp. S6380 TaxID=2926408 RepID=UPI001FF120A3|nr:biotin/lipoate--protein ligase family protein [Jannaschia sp. S6380]MCK0168328.1 biotin/lipoate--protein ligase family protein [Jannaschia sp. S6380]
MPDFPPLMRGVAAEDPRAAAIAAARAGCDGGTIFWRAGGVLDMAVVFAPDVPLSRAVQMAPLCAVALRDALGATGPAELPIHLGWDGGILLNGAEAGRVRPIVPDPAVDAVPDWVVIHLTLHIFPDDGVGTALLLEGGGDVDPVALLEAWARHLMHRLSEWEDGPRALHAELTAASWEREAKDAAFLGLSEDLGRLRRNGDATILDPPTDLLELP